MAGTDYGSSQARLTKTHEVSRREANASSTLTHCECQEHCWCRIRGLAMPPPVPAGVACRRYTRKRAGHRHQRRLRSVRQIDWYRARRILLRHGADHIAGRVTVNQSGWDLNVSAAQHSRYPRCDRPVFVKATTRQARPPLHRLEGKRVQHLGFACSFKFHVTRSAKNPRITLSLPGNVDCRNSTTVSRASARS